MGNKYSFDRTAEVSETAARLPQQSFYIRMMLSPQVPSGDRLFPITVQTWT